MQACVYVYMLVCLYVYMVYLGNGLQVVIEALAPYLIFYLILSIELYVLYVISILAMSVGRSSRQ